MSEADLSKLIDPNISCKVCGEKDFEARDGFFYCKECGTKQEQVRLVEIDNENEFDDKIKARKLKIHAVKDDGPKLTSWECYNYILRGLVEDLLSYGAKEELKLMALQVWAAYLRKIQVAFFNKKHPELPKLSLHYLNSDAEALYNHTRMKRKRRRSRKGDNASGISGPSGEDVQSSRQWNKSKRKLDESIYSVTSGISHGDSSGQSSSTSAHSNRAIRLCYNSLSRKILKKTMPKKHIEKHENDFEGSLKCHKRPKSRSGKIADYNLMLMNIKQVYSVLGIALNLIEDNIQLSDLVRFIYEGHVGVKNVYRYFPENIHNIKEILTGINFFSFPKIYSDKSLREHISLLCKNLGINCLKTPNMKELLSRYVTELCLPQEICTYAERLVNLFEPEFKTRVVGTYPEYEARAMAYIVFVLKLLFGLDGHREEEMSVAAKKCNKRIKQLNRKYNEDQPMIFVWSEWVNYIEMRKVIVSQFNVNFAKQFKQPENTTHVLDQMIKEHLQQEPEAALHINKRKSSQTKNNIGIIKTLFEAFSERNSVLSMETESPALPQIDFQPTFTPGLTYFNNIKLYCDSDSSQSSFKIPEFMRVKHAERNMESYLKVKPLLDYFQSKHIQLKVGSLPCNTNRNYIGIYRPPHTLDKGRDASLAYMLYPDFNISQAKWLENITTMNTTASEGIEFKKDLEEYLTKKSIQPKQTLYKEIARGKLEEIKLEQAEQDAQIFKVPSVLENQASSQTEIAALLNSSSDFRRSVLAARNDDSKNFDLESLRSFDVFHETNMNPLQTDTGEVLFVKPRRHIEENNLFADITDEDYLLTDDVTSNSLASDNLTEEDTDIDIKKEEKAKKEKCLEFLVSNMDCWLLWGFSLEKQTKFRRSELHDKLPLSFSWLLETCAQTICHDWFMVYDQLLVIELMYSKGITNLDSLNNCLQLNYTVDPKKDIQRLVYAYRDLW